MLKYQGEIIYYSFYLLQKPQFIKFFTFKGNVLVYYSLLYLSLVFTYYKS